MRCDVKFGEVAKGHYLGVREKISARADFFVLLCFYGEFTRLVRK